MITRVSSMAVPDDPQRVDGGRKPRSLGALSTPLQELELSVRAFHVLDELGIECVGDLVKLTPQLLSAQRNCGRKTIAEISGLLERFGAVLGEIGESAEGAALSSDAEQFDQLPPERKVPLLRRVTELRLSIRSQNTLVNLGIE